MRLPIVRLTSLAALALLMVALVVAPALADVEASSAMELVVRARSRGGVPGMLALAAATLLVLVSRPVIPGRRASTDRLGGAQRH
jgi:hypothetical protein